MTERVLQRVRAAATGGAADELADLTAQERKILLLVAEGKTNKEVAAEVFLSDKTVKNYVSSILSKLNLSGGPGCRLRGQARPRGAARGHCAPGGWRDPALGKEPLAAPVVETWRGAG